MPQAKKKRETAAKSPRASKRGAAAPSSCDSERRFPIVGVGASAGGLAAFTQLLQGLPQEPGLALVLLQHLTPERESHLAEILGRATALPISEVGDDAPRVQPNRVYILPPDRDMVIVDGALQLEPRAATDGRHHPIDRFFRSLAADQGAGAIGVVLSGTATDGTLGLEEIKAADGITFAQDKTAEHRGMPSSAIDAGCADFVLAPQAIAQELLRLAGGTMLARAPAPAPADADKDGADDRPLGQILHLLQRAKGVTYSDYKANTVNRRIARRMILRKHTDMGEYLGLLRSDSDELEALAQDLLIGVTSFFRNPESFEQLKKLFPRLVENIEPGHALRGWAVGCSTGQEAYTLAMAYTEFADNAAHPPPLQVFATDLSDSSIRSARTGYYDESALQEISPERRRRFFTKSGGQYRISKQIRDLCVFASHNLLGDPPFARLDLLCCRNVMMYLRPSAQTRVVQMLHYALKPGGVLMLGNSETVGQHSDLFSVQNKKHKLYQRKAGAASLALGMAANRGTADRGPDARTHGHPARPLRDEHREAERLLLSRYAPAGVLIDAEQIIQAFQGDTSPYLAPAPGKASLQLLKMAHRDLLMGLRTALHQAQKSDAAVRREGLRLEFYGEPREVSLEVLPVTGAGAPWYWVLFHPGQDPAPPPTTRRRKKPAAVSAQEEEQVARLSRELDAARDHLQATSEQYEAANEELQSANEEAQSANEELQSLNEELETSKEEIESSNEELTTLNEEVHNRNEDLTRLNDDLNNVFTSVQLPILMVDTNLRLRRTTPAAQSMFDISGDAMDRPLPALDLRGADDLGALIHGVIDEVAAATREVRDRRDRWFRLSVHPYKTQDNRIDGAVLSFTDIHALKTAEAYATNIINTVHKSLLVLDTDLRVTHANESFYRQFGITPDQTEGVSLFELGVGDWNFPELRRLLAEVVDGGPSIEDYGVAHESQGRGQRSYSLNARLLQGDEDVRGVLLLALEDITAQTQLNDAYRENAALAQDSDQHKTEFLAMLAHELRSPIAAIYHAVDTLGQADVDDGARATAQAVMTRQIQNVTRMVDDLLDVSRITSGKINLQRQSLDLVTVLGHASASVRGACADRGQELAVTLPDEPLWLTGDGPRLEQIFSNLLNNAGKFTPPGGHIRLSCQASGGQAVIRVIDDGCGLRAEDVAGLFQMFAPRPTQGEPANSGLGLGLPLVKSLVEMHGGEVEGHSAGVGAGSEFVVRLPLTAAPAQPAEAGPNAPVASAAPRRVLLVEDNADLQKITALMLRASGHEVQCAGTGAAALEAAETFQPQAVMIDLGLPDMEGFEVAQRLRGQQSAPAPLLIALSGYGEESYYERARAAGFDHYLVKPANPDALESLLAGAPE